MERRHRLRPDHTGFVVARLNDRRDQTRRADTVGTHEDRRLLAVRPIHDSAHRIGILRAEVENMADFNAAFRHAIGFEDLAERGGVMHFGRGGVTRRPLIDQALQRCCIVEIDRLWRRRERQILLVAEHFALAGLRKNDELVAEIAADRAGVGAHRDRPGAETRTLLVAKLPLDVIEIARQVLV